jgi:uroporphyrinogen-III synthase
MARQSTADPLPVLLTRPLPQSQAFARALAARFGTRLRPVISPLIKVQTQALPLPPGRFAGVIFTSANGVEAAGGMAGLPRLAWCVGDKTAGTARAAGFDARSAGGDAEALVTAITANPPTGRLIHLHGRETRGDIAARLTAAGVETLALEVYQQIAQPISEAARELVADGGVVLVPLFSPRTAQLFANAVSGLPLEGLRVAAMSPAVAAVVPAGAGVLITAHRPEAKAMLDAVEALIRVPLP